MTPDIKRRVIFTVLSDYVSEKDLWTVMWRWQNTYADRSRYELNQFLNDCKDMPLIMANRVQILTTLVRMVMNPDTTALKVDPIQEMMAFQSNQSSQTTSHSEKPVSVENISTTVSKNTSSIPAFNQLTAEVATILLNGLRSDQSANVRAYALSAIKRKKLPDVIYAMLEQPGKPSMSRKEEIKIKDARQLINFIYIGCCEVLGPVEADQLLSDCVDEINRKYRNSSTYKILIQSLLGR